MNLFVWGILRDRQQLSFILRRPYTDPFEPAILEGYMKGANWPDILFHVNDAVTGFMTEGDIAPIKATDLLRLDNFHALDAGVHKRIVQGVKAMRFGKIENVSVLLYIAGSSFTKIPQGVRLK